MNTMTAIKTELGVAANYDRNLEKAQKNGLDHCAHCGKGMEQGTGYLVRCIIDKELVINFDSNEGSVVRIGSTCIKKFALQELPTSHYVKAVA